METWTAESGGGYTNEWLTISNDIATWEAALGGGPFGAMMGLGGGVLNSPEGPAPIASTGTNVYFTNMTSTNWVRGTTFVLTIEGGTNGKAYTSLRPPI